MLIAMMTKTYETIRAAADTEWKFARTKLYMEYINENNFKLPVPFNLIPTQDGVKSIFKAILQKFQKSNDNTNNNGETKFQNLEIKKPEVVSKNYLELKFIYDLILKKMNGNILSNEKNSNDLTYLVIYIFFFKFKTILKFFVRLFKKVIRRIVKRFLLRNDKEGKDVTEGGVQEIKNDLQMVRFEMKNHISEVKKATLKSISRVHTGVALVGTPIIAKTEKLKLAEKFDNFKSFEKDLKERLAELFDIQ